MSGYSPVLLFKGPYVPAAAIKSFELIVGARVWVIVAIVWGLRDVSRSFMTLLFGLLVLKSDSATCPNLFAPGMCEEVGFL